ncbi:MAG: DMT family transporter [Gammaproteobacteria bacterium]|jgi:bacterial/archaeal transporter family-2 protein|nr:DMT family transporter [Gammaproteobacteria bacterium]
MNNLILISAVGLFGGLAIGLQAPLASIIGQRLGMLESVFIIHLGGLIAAAALLALAKGGNIGQWQNVPWYALAAGALGVILISAQVFIIPSIGVAATITLIIAGQLIMATCIDHFGFFEIEARSFDWERISGLLIVLLGVWLTIKK